MNFQSTGITGADTASQTCAGGDVAAMRVTFTEANLDAAAQGSYTDTLTAVDILSTPSLSYWLQSTTLNNV